MNRFLPLLLALSVSGAFHSAAQDATPTPLMFAVVSIHPSNPHPPPHTGGTFDIRPDGLRETYNSLSWLIQHAYNVKRYDLIENEPGWVDNELFDLEVKVAPEDIGKFQALSGEQKLSMLQSVLQDRFQLRTHTRVKELDIFYLEVAKGGSKLVESKPDAEGHIQTLMQARRGGEFLGKGLTIEQMSGNLSYFSGRSVVDHTSLKGRYDFDLKWSDSDDSLNSGPSFLTALSEQLGLKLVPAKAPFDAIVIDNVEIPTPN